MRLERTPVRGGFILADAGLAPEPDWFDPGYWRAHGAGAPLGTGRGIAVAAGPDARWVLRHYRRGGLPARWCADSYLWLGEAGARPVRELRLLAELTRRAAPVPKPVAARVVRRGLLYRGDILVERIERAATLAERAAQLTPADWAIVGEAIRAFHAAGGWHADLNARNVLLAPAGVYLVDLDRGRLVTPGRAQRRNLARLRRSLVKLGILPAASAGWRSLLAAYAAPTR